MANTTAPRGGRGSDGSVSASPRADLAEATHQLTSAEERPQPAVLLREGTPPRCGVARSCRCRRRLLTARHNHENHPQPQPQQQSRLGLLGWFRESTFEFHASVGLRFELAADLGEVWTWDGGIHQGSLLGMVFIVALYLPWC